MRNFQSLLLISLVYLVSCSHQKSFQGQSMDDELIYGLMGTKSSYLNNTEFDQTAIQNYEKDFQVSKVINLSETKYKEWLEETAKSFSKGIKPESLHRYIGRDLFLKASILEKYGELEKAEGLFSLLFQHFDTTEEAFIHHSILVLKMGDLVKAKESLKKAIMLTVDLEKKNDLLQVWLNVTEAASANDEKVVKESYEFAMKEGKASYQICSRYAKFLTSKKKYTESFNQISSCLKDESSTEGKEQLGVELAKIYVQELNFEKAIKYLESMHLKKVVLGKPKNNDGVLLLGLLYEQTEKKQKQVELYEAFFASGGNDPRILERLSDYYFESNSLDKGAKVLSVLSDLYTQNINYKFRLVHAYIELKKFQESLNVLEEIKQMGYQGAQLNLYLYKTYAGMDNFPMAINNLKLFDADEAVQLEALMLGGDYFTEKSRKLNGDDLKNLLTSWNSFLLGYKKINHTLEWIVQYAMCQEAKGEVALAVEVMEKAMQENKLQEFQLYYLASLYETQGEFQKTDSTIRLILDKNPEFAHAWNFQGYVQLERKNGDLNIAKSSIEKAVSLDPHSSHFRDSLGWYYFKTGQNKEALEQLQLAYTLNSTDITIAKHLIQVLITMKKMDRVSDMLERVSQSFPSEDFSDLKKQMNLDRIPASE